MLLIFTYYLIDFNYGKITQENKEGLLTLILQFLEKCLIMNSDKQIVVVVLNKLFKDMNMKYKKEILKEVFANNFANYFQFEPHFIYLMFTLLKKLKDPKIINITLLKNFRLNYHLFFENVNLAKFMIMLLDENF